MKSIGSTMDGLKSSEKGVKESRKEALQNKLSRTERSEQLKRMG